MSNIVTFRADGDLVGALDAAAETHDLSRSRLVRMVLSGFLSTAEVLDGATREKLAEFRDTESAAAADTDTQDKEQRRKEDIGILDDIKHFRENVEERIAHDWENQIPPENVAKDLDSRREQVQNWYDGGHISDAEFHEYQRWIRGVEKEYRARWADRQSDYDPLEDTPLAEEIDKTAKYQEIIETAAKKLHERDHRGVGPKQLRDQAYEEAPPHYTKADVWREIQELARDIPFDKAVKRLLNRGLDARIEPWMQDAAEHDPLDRPPDVLATLARQMADPDNEVDTADPRNDPPPDPRQLRTNGHDDHSSTEEGGES